jgi:hypothetical protein
MKKWIHVALGTGCLCLVFAFRTLAEDKPDKTLPKCQECSSWAAQACKKRNEVRVAADKLRAYKEEKKGDGGKDPGLRKLEEELIKQQRELKTLRERSDNCEKACGAKNTKKK